MSKSADDLAKLLILTSSLIREVEKINESTKFITDRFCERLNDQLLCIQRDIIEELNKNE